MYIYVGFIKQTADGGKNQKTQGIRDQRFKEVLNTCTGWSGLVGDWVSDDLDYFAAQSMEEIL